MSIEITCPDFCTVSVPVVEFSTCSPVTRAAQFTKMYIANPEEPMDDWTDPAEWATRISNTATDLTSIRELTIIGSMAAPESTVIKISGGRTAQGLKSRTVSYEIDDTSYDNIDAGRQFDCGGTFLFWFETSSGMLIGGPTGILGTINMDLIVGAETTELIKLVGTVKWDAKIGPMAIDSPIAE